MVIFIMSYCVGIESTDIGYAGCRNGNNTN